MECTRNNRCFKLECVKCHRYLGREQLRQLRKSLKRKAKQELRKRELARRFSPHWSEEPRVSKTRSALKTVAYRAFSATETALLAWLVVPAFGPAVFALLDSIGNTAIYYLFERVWSHIELWERRKVK